MLRDKRRAVAFCLLSIIAISCGDEAEFTGPSGIPLTADSAPEPSVETQVPESSESPDQPLTVKDPSQPPAPDDPEVSPPSPQPQIGDPVALRWLRPCGGIEHLSGRSSTSSSEIVGGGSHRLEIGVDKVELSIEGDVCIPGIVPRDILLMIDVSRSMGGLFGNDPKKKERCGRLDAVGSVLEDLGPSDRVGLITFSGDVRTATDGFLLAEDLRNAFVMADTLCQAHGNTNYTKALEFADSFFEKSRGGSAREVYFVSDGKPKSGGSGGSAAEIVRQYATIATLMLKGDDSVLKRHIATTLKGLPLHAKVADAGDLAETLRELAAVDLLSMRLIFEEPKSGFLGELPIEVNESSFNIAPFIFDRESYPEGLRVDIEFEDSRANTWRDSGDLLWP